MASLDDDPGRQSSGDDDPPYENALAEELYRAFAASSNNKGDDEPLYETALADQTLTDKKGGDEPPYENALAEELYRAFAASSEGRHSQLANYGAQVQQSDVEVAPAGSSRSESGFETGHKKASATSTFEKTTIRKVSHKEELETENRVAAGDEKATQQPQASIGFHHRLPGVGSPMYTASDEESDWSGKNDTGYESEDPRRTQRLLTPVEEDSLTTKDNGGAVSTTTDYKNSESIIPCFTATFDKEGGVATSGSISLGVPPFSVSEPTQFSSHILLEGTGFPDLTLPDNHYPLSPILSLSPHDAKFQQKVTLRFPFSATPKDWLLRLLYCPLNGDRWEALVDVLLPHNLSASSVIVMSRHDTLYDPGTSSIFVDHFCGKRWVGVPIHPTSKNQILCALFGRSLGTSWEVIVRCFSPYTEVYRYIVYKMQNYGAEPLTEDPELLEIGESGDVRIAFEKGDSSWQLEGGAPEILAPAKSTFWDAESPLGYRHKFIIRPERDTDYVRAVVSVKHIDNEKRELQSIWLDGSAPIRDRSSRKRTHREGPPCTVFNITHCSDMAIGSNSQLIDRRATASVSLSLPPASPGSHDIDLAGDTARLDKREECPYSCGVGKTDSRHSKITTIPCSTTVKSCKPDIVECGQQQGVLFVGFPREEGKHAPLRCTIAYLGCRDATLTKSSEGTRTSDEFVVQTWKPSWPHPDRVTMLIRNEEGHTVGYCCLSMGASKLPVNFSVMVASMTNTGKQEEVLTAQEKDEVDITAVDEQSQAHDLGLEYSSVWLTKPSSWKPPRLYEDPLCVQADIRPIETGLVPPKKVNMSGEKFLAIINEVRDGSITVEKAVEKSRTYTYTTLGAVGAKIPDHANNSKGNGNAGEAKANIRMTLRKKQAMREDAMSLSSSETTSIALSARPVPPRPPTKPKPRKPRTSYREPDTDESTTYAASLVSFNSRDSGEQPEEIQGAQVAVEEQHTQPKQTSDQLTAAGLKTNWRHCYATPTTEQPYHLNIRQPGPNVSKRPQPKIEPVINSGPTDHEERLSLDLKEHHIYSNGYSDEIPSINKQDSCRTTGVDSDCHRMTTEGSSNSVKSLIPVYENFAREEVPHPQRPQPKPRKMNREPLK